MFAKLACCIVCMGVFGCSLLAMRQARLQAAHEMAQTQLRIRAADERLFKLRTEIGLEVRPDHVRSLVAGVSSLKPIIFPREDKPGVAPASGTSKGAVAEVKPGAKPATKTAERSPAGGKKPAGDGGKKASPSGSRTQTAPQAHEDEHDPLESVTQPLDEEPLLAYEPGEEDQ